MKKCAKWIYLLGYPSILMQMLYTVYIIALNMILAGFSDAAVTVLGLYYKMQTFFFIPLLGLQTCIVPVLSYNYAAKKYKRCQTILNESVLFSMLFMLIGVFCFELLPGALLSLIRQLGCLIPIFFALSKIGLSYTWIAFPASEIITGVIGVSLYLRQVRQWAGGVD